MLSVRADYVLRPLHLSLRPRGQDQDRAASGLGRDPVQSRERASRTRYEHRHHQQAEQQRRGYPECQALTFDNARCAAGCSGRAGLRHQIELAKSKAEKQQRQADEKRPIWFKRRQVSNPCSTDAECQQDQRRDAAGAFQSAMRPFRLRTAIRPVPARLRLRTSSKVAQNFP
jgi:hypothetical protein